MFDSWTSKIMTSYLAITGHWLSSELELCLELLLFSELNGSHSSENISQEIYGFLERYDICDKVYLHIYHMSISEMYFSRHRISPLTMSPSMIKVCGFWGKNSRITALVSM